MVIIFFTAFCAAAKKDECCERVLITANGPIANVQGSTLGKYFWNGTDSSGKSYYKMDSKRAYFLYHDSGNVGAWEVKIGSKLISHADSRATGTRRRTAPHHTVISRILIHVYVESKMLFCMFMNRSLYTGF
jgi:hypothetical protein